MQNSGELPYRRDLDGLRALAVLAVMGYHAGMPGMGGGFVGVDVFFVLSGYLITSLLWNELVTSGGIDWWHFWGRRLRRLGPAALVVVVATVMTGKYLLDTVESYSLARDGVYAILHLTNWQQFVEAVNYFNAANRPNLLVHYWTLAVEWQFYLFLFFLLFAVASVRPSSGAGAGNARSMVCLLLLLALASFGVSLVETRIAPSNAFFGTHARLWQFMVGALAGFVGRSSYHSGSSLKSVMSWVGVSLILGSVVCLDGGVKYPGYHALLPTVGAALYILGGSEGIREASPSRRSSSFISAVMSAPVSVEIGRLSYCLYLWHWPVFEFYKLLANQWHGLDRLAAVCLSFALASATYILVEHPVRYGKLRYQSPRRIVAGGTAALLGTSVGLHATKLVGADELIILPNGTPLSIEMIRGDNARLYENNCHVVQREIDFDDCVFGDVDSRKRVYLVGDSHAAHWFPLLVELAVRDGFALYVRTKSACIPFDVPIWNSQYDRPYRECSAWRRKVLEEIRVTRPQVVMLGVSSAHRPYAEGGMTRLEAVSVLRTAEMKAIDWMVDQGAKVALIADTPWLNADPLQCLFTHRNALENCYWTEQELRPEFRFPWSTASGNAHAEVRVVDTWEMICPDAVCGLTTDSEVKFRDKHHLTASYVVTLKQPFEELLDFWLAGSH